MKQRQCDVIRDLRLQLKTANEIIGGLRAQRDSFRDLYAGQLQKRISRRTILDHVKEAGCDHALVVFMSGNASRELWDLKLRRKK